MLKKIANDTVDLLCTDPPYGLGVLGLGWDKLVPPVAIWRECLRVLKPGAFAFVMSAPRQDLVYQMVENLRLAGFRTDFTSLFWVYSSGFPKALNISKAVDKKLGRKREVIATSGRGRVGGGSGARAFTGQCVGPRPLSNDAKRLDGSYGGFQPKPAVEVVIVAMKPCAKKTFVEQALTNGKGVTWFDAGRVPLTSREKGLRHDPRGRFPANLLVSDDALNEGVPSDESFSRFFDLDRWYEPRAGELPEKVERLLPLLNVPKVGRGGEARRAA